MPGIPALTAGLNLVKSTKFIGGMKAGDNLSAAAEYALPDLCAGHGCSRSFPQPKNRMANFALPPHTGSSLGALALASNFAGLAS